nr:Zgc:153345 protein [Danio rerio]
MGGLTEERVRVVAIIQALKAVGIRVKNWKNFLNGNSNCEQTLCQENASQRFAFGRDLHLLPQHDLPDNGGTVPRFLVEACVFLSQHLNTEGLFRKTGSLTRIRALRADLEQGKPVFLPPHSSLLQPSDVASLIKQFLRELSSPLIPTDLQIPLIQAQGLEMTHDQEGARNRTTLLITALFPSSNACALRYLCTFLRQVADRFYICLLFGKKKKAAYSPECHLVGHIWSFIQGFHRSWTLWKALGEIESGIIFFKLNSLTELLSLNTSTTVFV